MLVRSRVGFRFLINSIIFSPTQKIDVSRGASDDCVEVLGAFVFSNDGKTLSRATRGRRDVDVGNQLTLKDTRKINFLGLVGVSENVS